MAITLAAAIVWFEPVTPPWMKPPFACATGRHKYHRSWWRASECLEEAHRNEIAALPWASVNAEAVG